MDKIETFLWSPRRSNMRWVFIAAVWVSSLAHIPVIPAHLSAAPYMGLEFIVLTIACFLLGAAALRIDSDAVFVGAIATCGLAVIGYGLTRTFSFPLLGDDVGNWLEPWGIVSVSAELLAIGTAFFALRTARNTPT